MNCQNCGAELPEDVRFCTQCGAEMPEKTGRKAGFFGLFRKKEKPKPETPVAEQTPDALADEVLETAEAPEEPASAVATAEVPADSGKKKKALTKKQGILLGAIGGAVVVLAVAIWLCLPLIRYGWGCLMLSSGQYQKAWTTFEELEDFRNSPEKLRQSQYGQAGLWLEGGQIQEARQVYVMLGDYAESAQQIQECDYQQALAWLEEGKLQEALEGFTALGDYKDSTEQITETNYRRALDFMERAQYEKALELLGNLGDYKDSTAQLTECNYRYALALMEAGNWVEALPVLEALGDYKDSPAQLTECRYQAAVKLLAEGNFADALVQLEILGDYKDTAELRKESQYLKALKDLEDGEIVAGYDALIALGDYKDSAQKAKDVKSTYDRIKAKPKLFRTGSWNQPDQVRIYLYTKVIDSNTIKLEIHASGGAATGADYNFTGKWDPKTGKLKYTKGTCYAYEELWDANGNPYQKKGYAYKNGTGYFYYKNGLIHWVDNTKGERWSFKYTGK